MTNCQLTYQYLEIDLAFNAGSCFESKPVASCQLQVLSCQPLEYYYICNRKTKFSVKKSEDKDYSAVWTFFITDGNQEALGMIYFSHYDLLYNFGLRYTKDNQIIEDAIQDVFSYFLKSAGKLMPVKNLRAFLLQSFRHQLIFNLKIRDRFNSSNKLNKNRVEGHEPEVERVFEKEWNNRLGNTISKCIEKLSEKQKEAIFLRFQSELSYDEMAVILEITVDSCYKLVYRSLKELRQEVERLEKGSKHLMGAIFR